MSTRQNLFCPEKLSYVQGHRPRVDCILCSAYRNEPGVENLIVWQSELFFVTLNLYPYNPGHLMIVPVRHTCTIEDFTEAEILSSFAIQRMAFAVLRQMYNPKGFNLGYNLGHCSGASIDHVHLHVVPRYQRELGFMDVLNGSRIIVEDPIRTRERMAEAFLRESEESLHSLKE